MYVDGKMMKCEGHKVVPISIMQLKMRRILCCNVPIRDKFRLLSKNVVQGSLEFPFNWTIKLTLAQAS